MKWRCTWCGKPHAANDPPCDNCGHNKFEEAIVRADEAEAGAETDASADVAGSDSETAAETEPDTPTGTVDTGTTYVWRCGNCGRDHVKYNPPCSRCGNHDLEKTEQTYDDVDRDLETPSWLEVAKPYTPVIVVLGLIIALFATGIVPLSVLPGIGEPSPPDAPGEGSEAAGIDLEETERLVHERLEADRDADGSRTYDDGLAGYAEYLNRAAVAIEYDDAQPAQVSVDDFDTDCSETPAGGGLAVPDTIGDYDDEADLAETVADGIAANEDLNDPAFGSEGLDLHVTPDESVAAVYLAC